MISLALSLALTSSGICNPLQKCNLELEAEVGIEHQNLFYSNRHNSQQHKPLRSFLNVFKPLTRVSSLQELLWNYCDTISNPARYYSGTIILRMISLEVIRRFAS